MNKVLLFSLMIILLTITVTAVKVENIPCVGDIKVEINAVEGNTNYTFINCNLDNTDNQSYQWVCSCNKTPDIINLENQNTIVTFRMQYYINKTRTVLYPNATNPTQDEMYNQQLKRVETRIVNIPIPIDENAFQFNVDTTTIILGSLLVIGLLAVVIVVGIGYFVMNTEKLKRRLGMDLNKPATTWEIIVAILSRKKVEKKSKDKKIDNKDYNEDVKKLMKDL